MDSEKDFFIYTVIVFNLVRRSLCTYKTLLNIVNLLEFSQQTVNVSTASERSYREEVVFNVSKEVNFEASGSTGVRVPCWVLLLKVFRLLDVYEDLQFSKRE